MSILRVVCPSIAPVIVWLSAQPVFAQSPAIVGMVRDETGGALLGVVVDLKCPRARPSAAKSEGPKPFCSRLTRTATVLRAGTNAARRRL